MNFADQRDIIQAAIDGKKVLYRLENTWLPVGLDHYFAFSAFEYRIEEQKKKRLIRVDELPPVCHVRVVGSLSSLLIDGRNENELRLPPGEWAKITKLLANSYEWSSDLKTWHSFEVEE